MGVGDWLGEFDTCSKKVKCSEVREMRKMRMAIEIVERLSESAMQPDTPFYTREW